MRLSFVAAALTLAGCAMATMQIVPDRLEARITHGNSKPPGCLTFEQASNHPFTKVTDIDRFCKDWNSECQAKVALGEAQPIYSCGKSEEYAENSGIISLTCITGRYAPDYLSGQHLTHTFQMAKSRNLEFVYPASPKKPVVGPGCTQFVPGYCSTPFYDTDAPGKICPSEYRERSNVPVCAPINQTDFKDDTFEFLLPEGRTERDVCDKFNDACVSPDKTVRFEPECRLKPDTKKTLRLACTLKSPMIDVLYTFQFAHDQKLSQLIDAYGKCTPVENGKCAIDNYDTRPRDFCAY